MMPNIANKMMNMCNLLCMHPRQAPSHNKRWVGACACKPNPTSVYAQSTTSQEPGW